MKIRCAIAAFAGALAVIGFVYLPCDLIKSFRGGM